MMYRCTLSLTDQFKRFVINYVYETYLPICRFLKPPTELAIVIFNSELGDNQLNP